MKRRTLPLARLALMTCIGVLALHVSSAHAALWVCHKAGSNSPINFAFMNQTPTRCTTGWYERAWFTVKPGKCVKVWTGDARTSDFWWTAYQQNELAVWGNDLFKAYIPLDNHQSGICRETAAEACSGPEPFCRWSSLMYLSRTHYGNMPNIALNLKAFNGFEITLPPP